MLNVPSPKGPEYMVFSRMQFLSTCRDLKKEAFLGGWCKSDQGRFIDEAYAQA